MIVRFFGVIYDPPAEVESVVISHEESELGTVRTQISFHGENGRYDPAEVSRWRIQDPDR